MKQKRIPPSEAALFFRRLSDLLKAGIPLYDGMMILERQAAGTSRSGLIRMWRKNLESGQSLSHALQGSGLPPRAPMGLLRAGEASGRLEEALDELGKFLEQDHDARQRIRAALAYPALLLMMAAGLTIFLMMYVVPRFHFLFEEMGDHLPWPTRALLNLNLLFRQTSAFWIAGVGCGFVLAVAKRDWTAQAVNHLLMKPIWIRNWIQAVRLQRWAHMMESLLRGGLAVPEAVNLSAESFGTGVFPPLVKKMGAKVQEGHRLADAVRESRAFPSFVEDMVAAGEESDRLEEMFGRLAQTSARETEQAMKTALSVLEPSLIVVMGGVIGFVALALLLPLFQMSSSLR